MRASYGSWKSPITTELITAGGIKLSEAMGFDGRVFWVEGRPSEKGRYVVVEAAAGEPVDRVGPEANVRTRVHEYGGGAFTLHPAREQLLYTDFKSQDLLRVPLAGGEPTLVATGKSATYRYADMVIDSTRDAVICVREDHSAATPCPAADVVNTVVSLPLALAAAGDGGDSGGDSRGAAVLAEGADFYSSPQVSPGGTHLAYVSWNHPSMPWDDTELWLLPLAPTDGHSADGGEASSAPVRVAGGGAESVMEPKFSPDGSALFFISDRTDYWNLYRYTLSTGEVEAVLPIDAEVGGPVWQLGTSAFDFVQLGDSAGAGAGALAFAVTIRGRSRLLLCDLGDGTAAQAQLPFVLPVLATEAESGAGVAAVDGDRCVIIGGGESAGAGAGAGACELPPNIGRHIRAVGPRTLALLGGGPASPLSVIRVDLGAGTRAADAASGARCTVLREALDTGALGVDNFDRYISTPEVVEFPTVLADGSSATAFANYYPPRNLDYCGGTDEAERPPLIVKIHGGPTSHSSELLRLDIQYWTSRGFAVADVNYGGSTGFGRRYRERLRGAWGVVDVNDVCAVAQFLSSTEARGTAAVDAEKLAIDGGSAGGFTTLAALCFRETFSAGTSMYGVADLAALAADTHKFESRYLDRLVAPYPEGKDIYAERSPIHHVDGLDRPILLLQGAEDKIVPPNQAEMMYAAVKEKGLPVALIVFEGEQHGFRQSKNIRRALEVELLFYGRIFGFVPADAIESFDIDNI